jgi:opacity protein-like surface antigen
VSRSVSCLLARAAFLLCPGAALFAAEATDMVAFPHPNSTSIVDALDSASWQSFPNNAVIADVAMQRRPQKSAVRPYIGAIVGASFATLADVGPPSSTIANESLFTAGGTLGLSFDRSFGGFRVEIEGRGRDQILSSAELPGVGDVSTRATDNWSTLVNGWLDLDVTDRLSIYGGGGIGGGGYRTVTTGNAVGFDIAGTQAGSAFAWQAGGGVYYAVTDRFAIDLGYRFFAIGDLPGSAVIDTPPPTPIFFNTAFSSSELLLTLRFYEPFRRWR